MFVMYFPALDLFFGGPLSYVLDGSKGPWVLVIAAEHTALARAMAVGYWPAVQCHVTRFLPLGLHIFPFGFPATK